MDRSTADAIPELLYFIGVADGENILQVLVGTSDDVS
jgi:hypothetical protein